MLTANVTTNFNLETPKQNKEIQHYLQDLTNRIAKTLALPNDMPILVHYVDDDTVNAFATLGGHLIFFRGLLEQLPNENALAMVISHEVAHIKHRHPIEGLSRAALLGIVITMVSGSTNNNMLESVLGDAGLISAMTFSREQEQMADETALISLYKMYGHLNGATALFDIFTKLDSKQEIRAPQFLSSHPLTDSRIRNIGLTANKNHWHIQGTPTKLPENYHRWLEKQE